MEDKKETVFVDQVTKTRIFDPEAQRIGSPLTPVAVSYEPMGTDSSSVVEVTAKWVEEEKKDQFTQEVNAWHQKLDVGKDIDWKAEIQTGLALLEEGVGFYNQFLNLSAMTSAWKLIQIGKVLNTLKKLTRKAGLTWEIWVEKNLSFIKDRTRARAMSLASRTDCHQPAYLALGSDRLELLCSMTKEAKTKKEKDPIGELLQKYAIQLTQDPDESLQEFKASVDAALSCERLLKNEFSFDFTLVKALTVIGVKFNQALITDLQRNQASGGDPKRYLELLLENEGKVLGPDEDEQRLIDFNSLSTRLVKTIAYIEQNEGQLDTLDKDLVLQLFDKLQALKTKLEGPVSEAE